MLKPLIATSVVLLVVQTVPSFGLTVNTFDDVPNRTVLDPNRYPDFTMSGVRVTTGKARDLVGWDYNDNPDVYVNGGHQMPFTVGNAVLPGFDHGSGIGLSTWDQKIFGQRPAGDIRFDFNDALSAFEFVIIDVEGPEEFVTSQDYFLDFRSAGTSVQRIYFNELITPGEEFYDPTVEFGNGSANRFAFLAADFGVESFDSIEFSLGGSGTIDEIAYEKLTGVFIPTPATLPMLAIGAAGLWMRRRPA